MGTWANLGFLTSASTADEAVWSATGAVTGPSPYLFVAGFNLGVPASATITGIEVQIRVGSAYTNAVEDTVRLGWGGSASTLSTANKASGAARTAQTDSIVGGPADLWGETSATLTPAVVNAASFGVVYRVSRPTSSNSSVTLRGIMLRVTYDVTVDGQVRSTQVYAEVLTQTTKPVRTTQVYAEVLTKTAKPVRVTQVYAEVLRSIGAQTARPRRMIFFQGG